MPDELATIEALRGFQVLPHPDSPAVKILRIDGESSELWLLVTRNTLEKFASGLAEEAKKIAPSV